MGYQQHYGFFKFLFYAVNILQIGIKFLILSSVTYLKYKRNIDGHNDVIVLLIYWKHIKYTTVVNSYYGIV